jgi:hypothetical protein
MFPRFVAVLLLIVPGLLRADVSIVRVWPQYRTSESFRRISEYFSGSENLGNEAVLRTQADHRDGYYFLTRIHATDTQPGSSVVVEVVLPGSPAIHTFTFPADLAAKSRVYHLGVTGTDWPSAKTRPTAWRVSVRNASGATVASERSFLWSASRSDQ